MIPAPLCVLRCCNKNIMTGVNPLLLLGRALGFLRWAVSLSVDPSLPLSWGFVQQFPCPPSAPPSNIATCPMGNVSLLTLFISGTPCLSFFCLPEAPRILNPLGRRSSNAAAGISCPAHGAPCPSRTSDCGVPPPPSLVQVSAQAL